MLTLEELRITPEFQQLTEREKLFVATYISNGYDQTHAVRTAYDCKDDGVASRMSYRLLAHLRIVMVLARYREEVPKETFLHLLRRAGLKNGITREQLSAFRLYAEVNGWIKAPKQKAPETSDASVNPIKSLLPVPEYDLEEYEPEKPEWRVERDAKRLKEQ